MNFVKMFQMQSVLDNRIRKEHNLIGKDLINEKILAFQVELAELANETRCFKYWSLKPASKRSIILEEYVDGIHFLLSIGLDLQFTSIKLNNPVSSNRQALTSQFSNIFKLSSDLFVAKDEETFSTLVENYFLLGELLQFTKREIEDAYIGKNEVNHQRQTEGY